MKLGRILPIAVGIAVVVAVGAYVFMGKQQEQQKQKRARAFQDQPAPVLVAPARNADVPIYLDAVGNTKALNTATVRPQVGGQIVKILFREGQDVKRGDVLAEIDPRTYQAQFDQAVAKKAQDEATLANARLDLDRYTQARGVEFRLEAAGRHPEGAGRAARGAGAGRSGGDRQHPRDAELHQDHGAVRRPHRAAPDRRRQSGAGGRRQRRRGDHADPADLGHLQSAAAAVSAGQQGLRAGHAAGRRDRGRRQDDHRSRQAAGDRQPDGPDHRHDPDEGGVSQRAAPALARTVRQCARAGRDVEAGRRGAGVGGAARAERNVRLCGRCREQGRGAAGQGRASRTTPAR